MEIEIIERENSPEKLGGIHEKIKYEFIEVNSNPDFSIILEPIKIFAQYFVCEKCHKFFDTKYKLERHKIGLGLLY